MGVTLWKKGFVEDKRKDISEYGAYVEISLGGVRHLFLEITLNTGFKIVRE